MRQRCLQSWQIIFLPLFLIHSLSTSSLVFNAVCIVISFLVFFLSICLSSKGPEYLTGDTAQVFIPLIWFLLESFVTSSFLVLLRYYFWILSFMCTCLMVSASKIPKYIYVSFFKSVLILCWFVSSIPSMRCRLPLFITTWKIFLCKIPFLCSYCIF